MAGRLEGACKVDVTLLIRKKKESSSCIFLSLGAL